MAQDKPGRNDPCPCGSGLKYKRCCLRSGADGNVARAVHDELEQALQGREFETVEEAQAAMDRFMAERNQRPMDDFRGLSPQQMDQVLQAPFDSPSLVTFTDPLPTEPRAPIVTLFTSIAEAVGEKGFKPTAKGNLPRQLCRDALQAFTDNGYEEETPRFGQVSGEEDFPELHVTRLVAELSGLLRKNRGRFILGREARDTLKREGLAGIYPQLFRAHAERFNWAYSDRHSDLPIIQQSWLFTLYLLSRHGDDWRPAEFYEDAFVTAFPMALEEVGQPTHWSPEHDVALSYNTRALRRFVRFLGLAEIRPSTEGRRSVLDGGEIRKTPLLDTFVRFRTG